MTPSGWVRVLCLPRHLQYRPSRSRIHILAGMLKAVAFVEADGAGVVFVDEQRDALWRDLLGFFDQQVRDAVPPLLWRNHELVEVALAINCYKTYQPAVEVFGDHDLGFRDEVLAPALTPPFQPRGEVDLRIGFLPSAMPELDCRCFILCAVKSREICHYRSVSFSSMRRLRL